MRYRYALYFVPGQGSLLHRLGSALLGYDIYSEQAVTHPDMVLPEGSSLDGLTTEPRRYGLHATVVAPFFPAKTNEANLLRAAAHFCQSAPPVPLPRIEVAAHRGFMALRPGRSTQDECAAYDALRALAADAVRFFFPLRLPPQPAETARRLAGKLSPRQAEYARDWGYPYIFEEYDFHITLSGPVQSACAQSLHKVLFHYFEEATAEPLHIDHLCVCRQPVHKTDGSDEKHTGFFSVLECFPLNGTMLYG